MKTRLYRGWERGIAALLLLCAACATAPPTLNPVIQPTGTQPDSNAPTLSPRQPTDPPAPTDVPQTPLLPTIIFESNRSGRYEIYAMNSTGGSVMRLTNADASGTNATGTGSGSPDWSRDGLWIAFSSRRDGQWLQVRMLEGETAWVARSLVDLRGDFDAIPVSA